MKPWRDELLLVLGDSGDDYVKGEVLAEMFGFSRAAVWKKISILRDEGHPIEAVTNRGYRLAPQSRQLEKQVTDFLKTEKMDGIFDVYVTDTTSSTNLLAREAGSLGQKEIGVFAAIRQTSGRGRRGRTWLSDTDEGLWFSFLLRPDVDPRTSSSLTLLFGLCILKAIQRICNVPVGIKWPNDIISLQNGKKLCGILSETSMEDNLISYAVVGCGINVSQMAFPEEIQDVATSLLMEGIQITKAAILTAVLQEVASRYLEFNKGSSDFISEYRANCATLGRQVRVESVPPDEGTAYDISNTGDLLVRRADGSIIICASGEVTVRGMLGYL